METRLLALSVFLMIAALAPAGSAEDSDPPADACTDRLNVMAIAETVALHATACLTDSEVETMAAASGNPTWLYDGTPATVCTILSWGGPNGTFWYAAPCFVDSRESDNASLQPCTSLQLTGKAQADLCLPEPSNESLSNVLEGPAQGMNGTSDNETSSSNLENGAGDSSSSGESAEEEPLDCLGDIESDAPLTVQDCIDEVVNDPNVQDVLECVDTILPDATETDSMLECEEPENPCPTPAVVVDPLIVCGVDVCNSLILPDGCQVENPCPEPLVDLDQMIVCGVDVCNSLILPDGCRLDPCTGGQIGLNDECHDVSLCPFPTHVGILIDGSGTCIPVPTEEPCDFPEIGVKPDCHTVEPCGAEEGVGVKVDGSGLCLELCPIPEVGIGSTCVDPVGVVLLAVGIVLGVVNNGGCRPGTTPYTSEDFTWCASPFEIAMDSIPEGEVPGVADDTPDDNPETIAFEASHSQATPLAESTVPFFTPLPQVPGGLSEEEDPNCSGPCNVVLIRGYDAGGDGSGYGGYTELEAYLTDHGYDVKKIDIYNACLSDAEQVDGTGYGDHTVHFPKNHGSDNSCASKSHTRDTYIYHMGYHVAWWLHTTYGTEAFDVVAHSMGGLLVRYAIHKAGSGDPDFPTTKLHAQDVVSVGSPHGGLCCSWVAGGHDQPKQMDDASKTMKYLKANAQNPQGLAGTGWTLMSADADLTVQEVTAMGMQAGNKLWYTQNAGGDADAAYGHNDYFSDDILAMDANYKWKSGDGEWFFWNDGPHSVRRIYWGLISSGH